MNFLTNFNFFFHFLSILLISKVSLSSSQIAIGKPVFSTSLKQESNEGNDNVKDVADNCYKWFDGCNNCVRQVLGGDFACTKMACEVKGKSECKEYFMNEQHLIDPWKAKDNCQDWYDGCNMCSREKPEDEFTCTGYICVALMLPKCNKYFGEVDVSNGNDDEKVKPLGDVRLNPAYGVGQSGQDGDGKSLGDMKPVAHIPLMYNKAGKSGNNDKVEYCADSKTQFCKRLCVEIPECPEDECVYRADHCCQLICKKKSDVHTAKMMEAVASEEIGQASVDESSEDEKHLSWLSIPAFLAVVLLAAVMFGLRFYRSGKLLEPSISRENYEELRSQTD